MRELIKGGLALIACVLALQSSANATPITYDQIIYQSGTGVNPDQYSGTVNMSFSAGQLTILLQNTSGNAAGDAGFAILTGIGFNLPSGVSIAGGNVYVGSSSHLAIAGGGAGADISSQWAYANQAINGYNSLGLPVNAIVTSVNNGAATRFTGAPPTTIGGPDYGAYSGDETSYGGQEGIVDTIRLVLKISGSYSGDLPGFIDNNRVVLAFASPNTVPDGGSTLVLLGSAMTALGLFAGRRKMISNA